ncbi:SgcJ/EcaC family oxidoreductase [Brevibacillus sp. B_LB10_24]|uniref:SgcJ/EcaC family oxidoreductase n=1 Tax=Brevibacillus sp. B_LB10_24 TaxID=3380645 RepID=UPI0038BA34E6
MEHQEKDVKAIGEIFAALREAWNRGDGAAFGECFTEDADYVTFSGQHLKGRKQIAEVHQWLFDGPLKGSLLESSAQTELLPRFVTSEVAIVHGLGEVKLSETHSDPDDRSSINTNVVVKRNGAWKITAFHNCRIQQLPRGRG